MLTFLETWTTIYTTVLLVFVLAVLYKHTNFGNKGTRGWAWIIAGTMLYLLSLSFSLINVTPVAALVGAQFSSWVFLFLTSISFIFILIGVLKVIHDLIKEKPATV